MANKIELVGSITQNPVQGWLNIANFDSLVWIEIDVYPLKSQPTGARMTIELESKFHTFKFLAPNDITETLTHEYADYDSIASRGAELSQTFGKAGKELSGLKNTLVEGIKGAFGGGETGEMSSNAVGALNKTPVNYSRPDVSMVYKNTGRRAMEFTFTLYDCGSPKQNIINTVRALQSFSSPQMKGDMEVILPPHVFFINSSNGGDLINLDCAVLTGVQYTYKAPFIFNLPTSCELTLSFQGLLPVFNTSFNGTLLTTSKKIKDKVYNNFFNIADSGQALM